MSNLNLKAFGIREIGRNEIVLTNDQVHTLCYLVRSRLDYIVRKRNELTEICQTESQGDGETIFRMQHDTNQLDWQINNTAFLLSQLLPFEDPKFVPDMKEKLTELSNLLKPLMK